MSFILVSIWVAIGASVLSATHAQNDLVWETDKNAVHEGGCVEVIIHKPARLGPRLTLGIGNRKPVRLDRLGRQETWRTQSVILLTHDLMGVLVDGEGDGAGERVTIPPFFAKPGVVQLTMYLDGNPHETRSIEVLEVSDEAHRAIDLLFPTVDREAPLPERERFSLWPRLVINSSTSVTTEQLQQLREELPIIMQHPDWAEIAEMLVARVEARAHYGQLITSAEYSSNAIKNSIGELPPWPEIVTRCLKAKPKSPFAQAIQHEIRGLERGVRILDLQRRGEDIWPILNEAARIQE